MNDLFFLRGGYNMNYDTAAQIMDEIAELTPTFNNVSFKFLDEVGSVQWPCNDDAPTGTPIMHIDAFVRGKGLFVETDYVPTEERTNRKFPLLLTTGRILSQYNVGAQTRRTSGTAKTCSRYIRPTLKHAVYRKACSSPWPAVKAISRCARR